MTAVIKVRRLHPDARLPLRATAGATGLDLYACLPSPGYLDLSQDVTLVPTGIAIEAPPSWDLQVRPRSGLSRQGVNAVLGTLDADYRGEVFVSMHTFGSRTTFRVEHGDRIAQLVVARFEPLVLVEVETIEESERGPGGHGSTGR